MPRRLRHYPPGSTVEVTIRTVQGRHLLRPSVDINEIILGILGRAQKLCGMRIHVFVFMSNHYHLIITIPDALALAMFECYLNGNLAKEAGRLHGWRDKFWSRRYKAIPILDDAAMEERADYLLSHGCKEGLVARPQDWPGVTSLDSMLTGRPSRGVWFDRTAEWFHRRREPRPDRYEFATPYEVELTPLPCWAHLGDDEHRARVKALAARIEQQTRDSNLENKHTPPGRAFVLAQDPHSHPDAPKRSPAPPCHTSMWSLRKTFLSAYYAFVDAYIEASARFRSGDLDAEFPADCFPPPLPFRGLSASRAPS